MMLFGNTNAGYLFVLFIPLLLSSISGQRKNRKAADAFAHKALLAELMPANQARNRIVKSLLIPGALAFCILALMRPLGGLQASTMKQNGIDIIIAVDVSQSMLSEDVKPNRLEFSKRAVRDFLKTMRGDRVGLVAFSGSAFLLCPLTLDYSMVGLTLDDLDTNTIPRGGTSLANAIAESVKGFPEAPEESPEGSRVILILTDGEEHEGDMLKAAEAAGGKGITIFTAGIGTVAGELIPLRAEGGRGGFLKDRKGNVIKSRLDEEALRKIALRTGGEYLRLADAGPDLKRFTEEKLSRLKRHETERKRKKDYREWFQIPLCMALLLLIMETYISERKKIG